MNLNINLTYANSVALYGDDDDTNTQLLNVVATWIVSCHWQTDRAGKECQTDIENAVSVG